MPVPTDYALLSAQRSFLKGRPWLDSAAYKAPVTRTVGGGGVGGANVPHVGGDTWEGSSNQGGVQFNNATQGGGGGGGHHGQSSEMSGGPTIHGYAGAGLNTRDFGNAFGRAPTAGDVEMAQGGGLAPPVPQMGSLNDYYDMLRRPSQFQQLQAGVPQGGAQPSGPPMATPIPNNPTNAFNFPPNTMFAADGGDIPADQPVVVGEEGPELVVPNHNVTVIPNNLMEYLKRFL